ALALTPGGGHDLGGELGAHVGRDQGELELVVVHLPVRRSAQRRAAGPRPCAVRRCRAGCRLAGGAGVCSCSPCPCRGVGPALLGRLAERAARLREPSPQAIEPVHGPLPSAPSAELAALAALAPTLLTTLLPAASSAALRLAFSSSSAFCGSSSGRPASMKVSAAPIRSSVTSLPRITMRSTTPGAFVVPVRAARSGIMTLPMPTASSCT